MTKKWTGLLFYKCFCNPVVQNCQTNVFPIRLCRLFSVFMCSLLNLENCLCCFHHFKEEYVNHNKKNM